MKGTVIGGIGKVCENIMGSYNPVVSVVLCEDFLLSHAGYDDVL